ncbi:hypothetical protein CR492_17175 [Methylocella silvestris]|uniref:Uncharacterized protein n=1 Tax=Methylocella silvestris TaxID=199596 RepID=A0A2J7TD89_METSI|nr:hypothetical protein CR492_17175 [Methylocella silvestris]
MGEPEATLAELQAWLMAESAMKASVGCLWQRPRRLGLTLNRVVARRRTRSRRCRQSARGMARQPA